MNGRNDKKKSGKKDKALQTIVLLTAITNIIEAR